MRPTLATLVLAAAAAAVAADDRVPFVIPTTPNPKSAIALAWKPIPTDAPRVVVEDGHFAAGGERLRVWGVNLCFGACFPKPEDAPRIAQRLAAAGINSVRFHHMDTSRWPSGILDPKDATRLHPEALLRLDVFLDQLARHGIYANLNLHVGRAASKALGLPDANTNYDKIVGIFTPELVAAQKQYARDLLTRMSTVRKVRYADDPAVAFIEITNEDSLFMWSADQDLRTLPDFYAKVLREKFADWLKARYGTTDSLRAAWAQGAEPLGDNLLADLEFKMPADAGPEAPHWVLEQHEGCRMTLGHPKDRPGAARIEIAKANATTWHLQLKQRPLALKGGRYYTLTFRARADAPRPLGYGVNQDADPWHNLGLSGGVSLTTDWQEFRAGFVAREDNALARLAFQVGGSAAAVELADVALRPGGREGLGAGESLEKRNVALFAPSEVEARTLDRVRFLIETEKAYFDEMRRFVRDDLGAKALVTGTIVFGPGGLYGQGGMDFIDGHSYWQHPRFPGRPWDPGNWLVNQVAMVDLPGQATLAPLAAQRLEGKPYTVSEYNHPAPNDFQAEGVPILAAYAAAQDWDGIWLFAYCHRTDDWDREAFTSFFDIDTNPAKWGFVRAGAAIFRDGAVPPLGSTYSISLGGSEGKMLEEFARLHLKHDRNLFSAASDRMQLTWKDLLRGRLAVALEGHTGVVQGDVEAAPVLAWGVDKNKRGAFMVSASGARVLVTHQAGETPVTFEGLEIVRPAFAAVTMTALDGKALEASDRILITACGRCENTGMVFSNDRQTVGRNWGGPPVQIEPVAGRAALPAGRWTCHALAPDGTPRAEVPLAQGEKGAAVLNLSPEHKTMWYLATRIATK